MAQFDLVVWILFELFLQELNISVLHSVEMKRNVYSYSSFRVVTIPGIACGPS